MQYLFLFFNLQCYLSSPIHNEGGKKTREGTFLVRAFCAAKMNRWIFYIFFFPISVLASTAILKVVEK